MMRVIIVLLHVMKIDDGIGMIVGTIITDNDAGDDERVEGEELSADC